MYILKKIAIELLVPFNLITVFLIIAFVLLLFNKYKLGTFSLSIALAILLFSGYGLLIKDYIRSTEAIYPTFMGKQANATKLKNISYIVVLGSGHVSDERLPANSQIGGSSLFRLVEGMRILPFFPDAKLIISGGIGFDPVPNGKVVAQVADSLGLPEDKVIVENRPRDSLQEAELLYPLLQHEEFILVTSALHMPRAMNIFKQHGMRPVPAPTDYILKGRLTKTPGTYLPTTRNLDLTRRMIYEWLGTLWMKIKNSSGN